MEPHPTPAADGAPSHHRDDIDGLRGVAVALVVAFHAWPSLVPGGYVGVDVFFVISGFVVARMVQRQVAAGRFSALDFFARRVNRLAPAMLLVLVATLAFGLVLLSPPLVALMVAHAAAALALASNLLFAAQASYFDVTAEVKPLLHLWSLSVEEQFYLAVPLAVVVARRLARVVRPATVALALASLATSVVLTGSAPQWAWFLPVTRAFELLAGVVLAQHLGRVEALPRAARNGLSLLGLALVLAAAFGFDASTPFPGAWALLPVLGAALVMGAGDDTALARLLRGRRLVALGLVSYPLYLWHWPLLTLGRLAVPLEQGPVVTALAVLAALGLASATFRFVEQPVRARQSRRVAMGLALGAAALAGTVTVAQLRVGPEGWSLRGESARRVARFERSYDYETDAALGTCWRIDEPGPGPASCVEETPSTLPLVFVWGDSHGARLSAGLRALQAERHAFRLGQRTRSSCPPLLEFGNERCRDHNQQVLLEAGQLQPAVLVLDARWTKAMPGHRLRATLDTVKRAMPATKVVVVGSAPEWRVSLPWVLSTRVGLDGLPLRARPDRFFRQREAETELKDVARSSGADFVSVLDALCTLEDGCLVRLSEEPLVLTTWDYGHLTTPAALIVARRLAQAW